MRLMDILNEVRRIQDNDILEEAGSKDGARKEGNAKRAGIFKFYLGKKVSKKMAAEAVKKANNDKSMSKIRNEVIVAFVKGEIDTIKTLLKNEATSEIVADYVEMLKIAHGGEAKMLKIAGKKASFLKKVLALTDGMSSIEAATEE